MRRIISLFLALLVLVCTICSCGNNIIETGKDNIDTTFAINEQETTKEIVTTNNNDTSIIIPVVDEEKITPIGKDVDEEFIKAFMNFSSESLYKSIDTEKSTFMSTFSVYSALALVANGADGETKKQFENVFGVSIDDLNEYLYSYFKKIQNGEGATISVANSIWVNEDRMIANEKYLAKTFAFYNSSVYKEQFSLKTVDRINAWVKDKTNDMIEKIIDVLSPDTVMCLLNTIYFDSIWENKYKESDLDEGVFTSYDKTKSAQVFLKSYEDHYNINKEYSAVKKLYKDGKYAFVAFLPNENKDIYEFAKEMTSEKYLQAMKSLNDTNLKKVQTIIPRLEIEYGLDDMCAILSSMGLENAFSPAYADFSLLGDTISGNNIYIGKVVHKAKLILSEKGTQASAATLIQMKENSVSPHEQSETINLNRPFLMYIIDNETGLPLFSGVVSYME